MKRRIGAGLLLSALSSGTAPAVAAIQTSAPQLLPLPGTTPVPSLPAPVAPPVSSGYVAAPADGISPILTTPGPVYQLPQPMAPAYPPPPIPGPIDQQKLQAYRNSLTTQQYQLQSQGVPAAATPLGREILRQLNTPDAQ
jgi:hypothetical protein